MRSKTFFPFIKSLLFLVLTLLLFSCGKKKVDQKELEADFAPYISWYSGGTLSKNDVVGIRFADFVVSDELLGETVKPEWYRIVPAMPGKGIWTDRQTFEFIPEKSWESGKRYRIEFEVGHLIDLPSHMHTLSFSFDIINQSFDLVKGQLSLEVDADPSKQLYTATVTTADAAEIDDLKKFLRATQNGRNLEVFWSSNLQKTVHQFKVRGINRKATERSSMELRWDGTFLGASEKGRQTIAIPSLKDFSILDVSVFTEPETYLIVHFSDPLDPRQELIGLLTLNGVDDFRMAVEGQELYVYPGRELVGEVKLEIHPNIKNISSYSLEKSYSRTVIFEAIMPAVKMAGNGTIVPSRGRISIPFESANLMAVDIGVFKLFEKNIHQHLQQGNMEDSYQINRVGELILYRTFRLDDKENFQPSQWQAWELDISDLVKLEPGAIYHAVVMFKPSYSLFQCNQSYPKSSAFDPVNADLKNNYDRATQEFFSQYRLWAQDWRERDNPCSPSYFNQRRWESRSLLATDLGITAKMGNDQQLFVAVNDLNTTRPLSNVKIEVFSYAGKLIQSGRTSPDGILKLHLEREPFLLVASMAEQKNYLQLRPNEALSVSRFEVEGSYVYQGIKGFIYGDRDVWRPGDSLFLSFILEDKKRTLPANHPVLFSVRDPNGVIRQTHTLNHSVEGIYHLPVSIPTDAITGRWSLIVEVGNLSFHSPLRIETIMPNRLRADIDFGAKELDNEHFKAGGSLNASWLHGAPASGLNADVNLRLRSGRTIFSDYPSFVFDDLSRAVQTVANQNVFNGVLDEEGFAKIIPDLNIGYQVPGMLNATFNIRVFEAGGNFSTEIVSFPFHPFDTYVGLKTPEGDSPYGILTNDREHTVDLVALDQKGNLNRNIEVEVNLYKLEWRWWWDRTEDNQGTFTTNIQHNHIDGEKLNLREGKGSWTFSVPHPEWGRYLLRVCDTNGEHCSAEIIYIDWPGWAGRADRGADAGASMLSFFVEKESYSPGEKIKITIPSPEKGRALVSVENGSTVLESHWVETVAGNTDFQLTAKKEWAPNIYIHISLLQPHAATENDRPIRMYGIVPVKIADPQTHLQPQIAISNDFKPEERASFSISEQNGRAMAYTVAVVDEGLLNITRFRTPDPWNYFYSKEALGVRSWDMYNNVAGAIGTNWGALLAVGGDLEIRSPDEDKANRFKPVVKYFGPFELAAGKTANHDFMMPNYVGSVRIMAVAAKEGAYGSAEKDVVVKKPLMVLATLPRVLGPGEEADMAISVFAMEESVRNVEVRLEVNDKFEIMGDRSQTINFNRPGEQVLYFRLKTGMTTGVGKVVVSAKSGREQVRDEIELDVRNPNSEITEVSQLSIQAGQEISLEYRPMGMAGSNYLTLEISSIPPLNLAKRLNYLMSYPHGCLEQTVSAAFPQLYLANLIELDPGRRAAIQRNINQGISRVRNMQLGHGGVSYWPGGSEINEWSSLYAGHFMIEAQKAGYQVPATFFNSWTNYTNRLVRNYKDANRAEQMTQAYALYLLALNGTPQMGAMNRMRSTAQSMDKMSLWRLAAAYYLVGRADAAEDLLKAATTSIPPYSEISGTFGSALRDQAIILQTMILMKKMDESGKLARTISDELSSSQWLSTQETAFALMAMSQLVTTHGSQRSMEFSFKIIDGNSGKANTDANIWQYQWAHREQSPGTVEIKNSGDQLLFVQLVSRGTPFRDQGSSSSANLLMEVKYLDMQGREINPSGFIQGTDFISEIQIRNPGMRGDYRELVLSTVFPSGWEILNERLTGDLHNLRSSTVDHRDIRDDRIYTYFSLKAGETKSFYTVLNAAYSGKTFLPPFVAEAMYDNSIQARNTGREIEVLRRN